MEQDSIISIGFVVMKDIVFVTSNQHKADYLAAYLGCPISYQKLELDEIQSLDLQEIVRHKVHQAYTLVNKPVIVDDVSLEFCALGQLPGPFIKWFMEELSHEALCGLLDGKDRSAHASCIIGYYDGEEERYFKGEMKGSVPEQPAGAGGFGWDPIFIPEGYTVTRAELNEGDNEKTYTTIKPFAALKSFLLTKQD